MPGAIPVAGGLKQGRPQLPLQIDIPGLEIGPDDTVVDIGCGAGTVCAYAGRCGAEVIGIDADFEAWEKATAAMREVPARDWRIIQSDCDPIPLPDETASVVIATEVLEHVEEPGRLLSELVRIGKAGAQYVISVPDPASESLMKAVAPEWYWKKPFHVQIYSPAELDVLVQGAGLEVVARASRGFHESLWWTFRMALGAKIAEPPPDHPVLRHWDAAWEGLQALPGGPRAAEALDQLIPKSQLILARKPGGTAAASSFGGPVWSRARWKRRIRDGAVRLGGFDIRWSVRRLRG
jgi:SAM-dependent methyltransferase